MTIELHQRDVAGLVRAGWLAAADRGDRDAIAKAFGAMPDAYPQSGDVTAFPAKPR